MRDAVRRKLKITVTVKVEAGADHAVTGETSFTSAVKPGNNLLIKVDKAKLHSAANVALMAAGGTVHG